MLRRPAVLVDPGAQTLTTVDMAAPRPGLSPELMTDWLEDRGQPVPHTDGEFPETVDLG